MFDPGTAFLDQYFTEMRVSDCMAPMVCSTTESTNTMEGHNEIFLLRKGVPYYKFTIR